MWRVVAIFDRESCAAETGSEASMYKPQPIDVTAHLDQQDARFAWATENMRLTQPQAARLNLTDGVFGRAAQRLQPRRRLLAKKSKRNVHAFRVDPSVVAAGVLPPYTRQSQFERGGQVNCEK